MYALCVCLERALVGLWLVVVCTHLLRILVHVFADPLASFNAIFDSLWVCFVVASSGVCKCFLSGGYTLLRRDCLTGVGMPVL